VRRPAPLAGGVALDRDAARRAIARLASELGLDELACAEGIVKVAETEMLRALRVMTVQRGIDPRRFALMGFGGAGPLHAASMADALGIERVLCPRACGVLCALGLAGAQPRRDAAATLVLSGDRLDDERLRTELSRLAERARRELDGPVESLRASCEMRYRGQSFELPVPVKDIDAPDSLALRARFEAAHEERYGYRDERQDVELVNRPAHPKTPGFRRDLGFSLGFRIFNGDEPVPYSPRGGTERSRE
jgi:N-methylhydantoinase A